MCNFAAVAKFPSVGVAPFAFPPAGLGKWLLPRGFTNKICYLTSGCLPMLEL